jgi:hypothetical protein
VPGQNHNHKVENPVFIRLRGPKALDDKGHPFDSQARSGQAAVHRGNPADFCARSAALRPSKPNIGLAVSSCARAAGARRGFFKSFSARLRSPRLATLVYGLNAKSCPDTCVVDRSA